MSISHEEAQKLIQFKIDDGLSSTNQAELIAHLNECEDCRAYSKGFENTISILTNTLHRQLSKAPPPLQMDVIYASMYSRSSKSTFLTTRIALVGVALMLFTFMAWQSIAPRVTSQQYPAGMIPLIPTPSMQHTVTNTSQIECQNLKYSIQRGDTLEGIAKRFSVPAESILLVNNLTNTSLRSIQEIVIPICETTPTSTTFPLTTTITPIFEPFVTTPG